VKRRGSVLILTIWVLVVLVLFAVGLAHRVSISLKLARYQLDDLQAHSLARAGVRYACALLQEDSLDLVTEQYDTPSECGVRVEGRFPEDVFSFRTQQNLPEGFRIEYFQFSEGFGRDTRQLGLQDESRRLNINTMDGRGMMLLALLLRKRGVEEEEVNGIADILSRWVAADSTLSQAKGAPLKNLFELHAVLEYYYREVIRDPRYQTMAMQAFDLIKDAVTLYGDGKVNINTVSDELLDVFVEAFAIGEQRQLAISVANKLKSFRLASAGMPITDMASFRQGLTEDEKAFFDRLAPWLCFKGSVFRIAVTGYSRQVEKHITCVYDRDAKEMLSWQES